MSAGLLVFWRGFLHVDQAELSQLKPMELIERQMQTGGNKSR